MVEVFLFSSTFTLGVLFVLVFQKKPFLLFLAPILALPALLLIMFLITSFSTSDSSLKNASVGAILSFTIALTVVSAFCASIILTLLGIYSWIKARADIQKKALAKKQMMGGLITIIIVIIIFIATNIVIQAIGMGQLQPLRIQKLPEIKDGQQY